MKEDYAKQYKIMNNRRDDGTIIEEGKDLKD